MKEQTYKLKSKPEPNSKMYEAVPTSWFTAGTDTTPNTGGSVRKEAI